MKKTLFFLISISFIGFASQFVFANKIWAASDVKTLTVQELAAFDGKNGNQAYTSYEGIIYDVTDSKLWKLGEHFGLNAGVDLTDRMKEAPHGAEVFRGFSVVGELADYRDSVSLTEKTLDVDNTILTNENNTNINPWYLKRIKIANFSILGLTGIILGVFFVLTFSTCFALPWAKLPLPWKGSRIGSDSLDAAGRHLPWSSIHKHFVWIAVIFGIIHGIIGFLQMIGIYL